MKLNILFLFFVVVSGSVRGLARSEKTQVEPEGLTAEELKAPLRLRGRDFRIPGKCRNIIPAHFRALAEGTGEGSLLTLSISQAHEHGFDLQYPLARTDADKVYGFFKKFGNDNSDAINAYRELRTRLHDQIENHFADIPDQEQRESLKNHAYQVVGPFLDGPLKFKNQSPGDILESVAHLGSFSSGAQGALVPFTSRYPVHHYFYYSGLEYFRTDGSVAGELDFVVAKRSDCQVAAIVQAKLGVTQRARAEEQNRRFYNFIRNH